MHFVCISPFICRSVATSAATGDSLQWRDARQICSEKLLSCFWTHKKLAAFLRLNKHICVCVLHKSYEICANQCWLGCSSFAIRVHWLESQLLCHSRKSWHQKNWRRGLMSLMSLMSLFSNLNDHFRRSLSFLSRFFWLVRQKAVPHSGLMRVFCRTHKLDGAQCEMRSRVVQIR